MARNKAKSNDVKADVVKTTSPEESARSSRAPPQSTKPASSASAQPKTRQKKSKAERFARGPKEEDKKRYLATAARDREHDRRKNDKNYRLESKPLKRQSKGRRETAESKELADLTKKARENMYQNVNEITPLHCYADGTAHWRIKTLGSRCHLPCPPKNIPPTALNSLENILVGPQKPFVPVRERRFNSLPATPMVSYTKACAVAAGVRAMVDKSEHNAPLHFSVLDSWESLEIIASTLTKCISLFGWTKVDISVYCSQDIKMPRTAAGVTFIPNVYEIVDGELFVNNLNVGFRSLPAIIFTAFSTTLRSPALKFMEHATQSSFVEVTIGLPSCRGATIGRPYMEASWSADAYIEDWEGAEFIRRAVKWDEVNHTQAYYLSLADLRHIKKPVHTGIRVGDRDRNITFLVSIVPPSTQWIPWDGEGRYETKGASKQGSEPGAKTSTLGNEGSKEDGKMEDTNQEDQTDPVENNKPPSLAEVTKEIMENFSRMLGPSGSGEQDQATQESSSTLSSGESSGTSSADTKEETGGISEERSTATENEKDEEASESSQTEEVTTERKEEQEENSRAPPPDEHASERPSGSEEAPPSPSSSQSEPSDQQVPAPSTGPPPPAPETRSPPPPLAQSPSAGDGQDQSGLRTTQPQPLQTLCIIPTPRSAVLTNRGGGLDPVVPVIVSAQRINGPAHPPMFVRHEDHWYFTRRFVSWLGKCGFGLVNTPVGRGAISLALLRYLFGSRINYALGGALLGYLWTSWTTRKRREQFYADDCDPADLEPQKAASLNLVVASQFAAINKLGQELDRVQLARIVSYATSVTQHQDAPSLAPNVLNEWDRLYQQTTPCHRYRNIAVGAALGVALSLVRPLLNASKDKLLGLLERFRPTSVLLGSLPIAQATTFDWSKLWDYVPFLSPPERRIEVARRESSTYEEPNYLRLAASQVVTPVLEESLKSIISCVVDAHAPGAGSMVGAAFGAVEYALWVATAPKDSSLKAAALRLPPLIMHISSSHLPYMQRLSVHYLYNLYCSLGTERLKAYLTPPLPLGFSHPPICTRLQRLKPIRPTASLTLRATKGQHECRPGQGFCLCGPYASKFVVYCYRSCEHNMISAATSRMGGVPKALEGAEDYVALEEAIDIAVGFHLPTAYDTLRALFKPSPQPLLTNIQWAERFPSSKCEELIKQWQLHLHKPRKVYDSFVKKEKSVASEDEWSWISRQDEGVVEQCEIKLDPRGISVPAEEVRVITGPWCHWLNHTLHSGFQQSVKYVPGDTPKELSQWLSLAQLNVASGSWNYALAVQGDDSLILLRNAHGLVYVSSDFSRYDMSQRTSHFQAVWDLLDLLDLHPKPEIRDLIQAQQGLDGSSRTYNMRCATLRVKGTMASGDGVTISFNSLVLTLAVLSFLVTRLPLSELSSYMRRLGFTITYQTGRVDEAPLALDFLQSRPWLTLHNGRVLAPKPGRVLTRFFWIPKTFKSEVKYKRAAADMALGMLAIANHVPIINDICRRVLELQPTATSSWSREGPEELQSWRKGSWEVEHPDTLAEMSYFYKIPISTLSLLRERCRTWRFGEPVDNTEELSTAVALLATADLA